MCFLIALFPAFHICANSDLHARHFEMLGIEIDDFIYLLL